MNIFFIVLIVIVLLGFSGVFYFLFRAFDNKKANEGQGMMMLQNQIGEIRQSIQSQYQQSLNLTKDLTEKLGKLDQTNQQIVGFADQLQGLQDILKNPKQRGVLGEYFLESVLKNVLPPKIYKMQYSLGKDEETEKELIVDAVIFIKEKIIPIDSKFSLENYNRLLNEHNPEQQKQLEKIFKQDLKNRIDETSKYIKPEKNTFDFAFMFIPSEAIYYDLLINQVGPIKSVTNNLIEYAVKEKRVIIVSPTTFLAYLQMVLQGLKSLQIEESAKQIKKNIEILSQHLLRYDIYFKKLGNHLETTVNSYNIAYKELGKIDKDVVKITGGGKKIEPLSLDRPKVIEE
ncbi:MAG: DNA recombination protein RmuC [Patescibacteria group bacterium]|jgi:DNA recombination protein RmuC|nr:DNA recombination protein RmuC [Patescibacteria group bacterium]MDD5172661.1 DNA recombination protein RmuC [Patescibacteria group bacterium]